MYLPTPNPVLHTLFIFTAEIEKMRHKEGSLSRATEQVVAEQHLLSGYLASVSVFSIKIGCLIQKKWKLFLKTYYIL